MHNASPQQWLPLALLPITVLAAVSCTPMPQHIDGTASPSAVKGACLGSIEPPYGLAETSDPALLNSALGQPGKGGLCEAKVFRVNQPLTVYRVWDSSKPYSQFGRWWSFDPPAGPVDAYRARNAICASWSKLDRVTQCRLKTGTEIVIGPGQSAQCAVSDDNRSYPASPETQVYVPNDSRTAGNLRVADCLADVAWPQ